MESVNIFVCLVGVIALMLIINLKNKPEKQKLYKYYAKKQIMTNREADFFVKLNTIFNERFFVIPQVHLSAMLDERVKGQNWRSAFRHINGKSVDYVLISRTSLELICAIELDDNTHDRPERSARDKEVERIFEQAKIPLTRFRDIRGISNSKIISEISVAIDQARTQ